MTAALRPSAHSLLRRVVDAGPKGLPLDTVSEADRAELERTVFAKVFDGHLIATGRGVAHVLRVVS